MVLLLLHGEMPLVVGGGVEPPWRILERAEKAASKATCSVRCRVASPRGARPLRLRAARELLTELLHPSAQDEKLFCHRHCFSVVNRRVPGGDLAQSLRAERSMVCHRDEPSHEALTVESRPHARQRR